MWRIINQDSLKECIDRMIKGIMDKLAMFDIKGDVYCIKSLKVFDDNTLHKSNQIGFYCWMEIAK